MRAPRSRALAAPIAIAALITTGATLPAHADTASNTFGSESVLALEPAPANGDATTAELQLKVTRGAGAPEPKSLNLTVDYSGVKEFATFGGAVGRGGQCSETGSVATCAPELVWTAGWDTASTGLKFTPRKGAAAGTSGKVRIKQTWENGTSTETEATVMVGGTRIEVAGFDGQDGLKPGATVSRSLTLTNKGQIAAPKLVLAFQVGTGLQFKQRFANCEYGDRLQDGSPVQHVAICTVNSALAPGETVHLKPIEFTVEPSALHDIVDLNVAPNDGPDAWLRREADLKPGGGTTRLVLADKPESGVPTGTPVADLNNTRGGYASVDFGTVNTADYTAVGQWKPNAGGTSGVLTAGLWNQGPASINDFRSGGEGVVYVDVALPKGASLDGAAPKDCQIRPGGHYSCGTGLWVPSGVRKTFDFKLKLAGEGTAAIVLHNFSSYMENRPGADLRFDPVPANNATSVALGAKEAGNLPTASPKPTAGGTATTGGTATGPATTAATPAASQSSAGTGAGGNLASTGSSGLGLTAGVGAAAVVAGGLLFLVARRRKAGSHQ
ncbi:hypothetical protein [Kitasatospora camelliae]|uniref:LPXTG-motif cell wall-anchored protein n=1 Tax=Kitasatospora camelliae TaxID=3156397 RepID=A0AAU8JVB4_9ACTN